MDDCTRQRALISMYLCCVALCRGSAPLMDEVWIGERAGLCELKWFWIFSIRPLVESRTLCCDCWKEKISLNISTLSSLFLLLLFIIFRAFAIIMLFFFWIIFFFIHSFANQTPPPKYNVLFTELFTVKLPFKYYSFFKLKWFCGCCWLLYLNVLLFDVPTRISVRQYKRSDLINVVHDVRYSGCT